MSHCGTTSGSWNEADVDRFFALAAPLVAGAQRQGAALTAGYLGLMVGSPVPPSTREVPRQIDFREPFLAYWAALNRGDRMGPSHHRRPHTFRRPRPRRHQLAARGTATEIDTNEDRITGWERVPAGVLRVLRHRRHPAVPHRRLRIVRHDRCNCDVVPIIGRLAPAGSSTGRSSTTSRTSATTTATGYVNATALPHRGPDAAPVEAP
jgi:hypothetical protein